MRSSAFKRWLSCLAYEELGTVPSGQALEDTIRVLEARAANEGAEREAWLRVGAEGDRLYLDLADREWRAVEIRPDGWGLVDRHSLPFIRSKSSRPLPEPEAGCGIDELRRFVNVAEEEDFILVVGWLVVALRNKGPYPILVVNGEQGSGKSTFSRLIRSVVDPNAAPIRSAPKEERDLVVSCHNGHVQCFDNLSRIDADLADSLCRFASGGGSSVRQHYSDKEENIFSGARPFILNGIPSLTDRADLADRAVTVRLQAIPEEDRRPEDEFWEDWDRTAPRVLGALCDALSAATRRVKQVRLETMPRLADFAKWVTAAEPGLGWDDGTFMRAYGDNRRTVVDTAFEASPIAMAVQTLIDRPEYQREGWTGTATELLALLGDMVTEAVKQSRSWPKLPQSLSAALDRAATILRAKGIRCERRHSGNRSITVSRISQA